MPSYKISYEKWHAAISELDLNHRRTCFLFNKQQPIASQEQQDDECGCGRLKRSHSYEEEPKAKSPNKWSFNFCSKRIKDMKNFGVLHKPYESHLTKVKRIHLSLLCEN